MYLRLVSGASTLWVDTTAPAQMAISGIQLLKSVLVIHILTFASMLYTWKSDLGKEVGEEL